MTCQHATPIPEANGAHCALHSRTCSHGVCRACLDNTAPGQWPPASSILQRARIGTRIKKATTAIGIKPCGGCKRRAQILNGDTIST